MNPHLGSKTATQVRELVRSSCRLFTRLVSENHHLFRLGETQNKKTQLRFESMHTQFHKVKDGNKEMNTDSGMASDGVLTTAPESFDTSGDFLHVATLS